MNTLLVCVDFNFTPLETIIFYLVYKVLNEIPLPVPAPTHIPIFFFIVTYVDLIEYQKHQPYSYAKLQGYMLHSMDTPFSNVGGAQYDSNRLLFMH